MYKVLGVDQKHYGPAEAAQIRQWIRERRLHGQSLVQTDEAGPWKPLCDFPEFLEALAETAQTTQPLPSVFQADWGVPPRTNPMAVLGLIMGLFSLTLGCCCCYGFPFNFLGIIFCAMGLSQIHRHPNRESGKGLAIAGLIMCVLSFVLTALAFLWGLTAPPEHFFREL